MSTKEELQVLRREYSRHVLDESSVAREPILQFTAWFNEISKVTSAEVNAMAVATADASGAPSVRMVLLKEFDSSGFVFYTNYESKKGIDLAANPRAALLFYWADLERQVRIEGMAERIPAGKNADYFKSRPVGAQLGALVSHQSRALSSRGALDEKLKEAELKFAEKEVSCPAHWGGYRVVPQRFEFWQGRENRLHDRICYQHSAQSVWNISRLYP